MMIKTLTAFAMGVSLVAACDHNDAVGEPTTTGATYNSPGSPAAPVSPRAADEIAGARCDREQTCNNIGVTRKYSTHEVCVAQLRAENENSLTNASCPNGLSRSALTKCVADIRGEQCDHPLDTLERLNSCSKSSLCP
jgi:Family of unknown function (DUF6184)